jgi:beta-aspartyl-peptidase (threonine type)
MLHASTTSWNAGELDAYLDDYWASEELTFSGPDGVTRGWEDLRTRYLNSYWAPDSPRDSLRFEELEVRPLGEGYALALGRYVLYQPEDRGAVRATGFFSLVLGRVGREWKILHDHTSAAPILEEPGEVESDLTGVG